MADYVTIANSDASLMKRYFLSKFMPGRPRSETREVLSSGQLQITRGKRQRVFEVTFLTPETSNDEDWGDLHDLERLHGYDLPGGAPSDVLHITLMDDLTHQVRWLGDFRPVPQGVVLYGEQAYYEVKAELIDVTRALCDFSQAQNSMYAAVL